MLELCFGDIQIAKFCRKKNIQWTGFDRNESFVRHAKENGFDARRADLNAMKEFPAADLCIMSASLYHFIDDLENMLTKMLKSSGKILISEPIINVSNSRGIIGFLARKCTYCGETRKGFRFDKNSFPETLNYYSKKLNFRLQVIGRFSRDLTVIIER